MRGRWNLLAIAGVERSESFGGYSRISPPWASKKEEEKKNFPKR
jgi:hypothetical protein